MKVWLRKHYHWVIFLIVFLEITVYGGLINCLGVFLLPITQDLGISRGSYALANSALYIASFFGNLATGFLFSRFGYKRCCVVSLVLSAAGMIVNCLAQEPILIAIGRFMLGMGYGVCFTAGAVRIIQNWFHKYRGLLTGAVSMSSGLGGSLLTILLNGIIESYNWQMAVLTAALLLVSVAILYVLLHDKPHQEKTGCLRMSVSKNCHSEPVTDVTGSQSTYYLISKVIQKITFALTISSPWLRTSFTCYTQTV